MPLTALAIRDRLRKSLYVHVLYNLPLFSYTTKLGHAITFVQMSGRLNVVLLSPEYVVHASDQQHSAEHGA